MKRNSKFLLLLAFIMSGILGVYFIGCDEETVNNPIPDRDRVIGSVHGVVSGAFDNSSLPNVQVSWVSNGQTRTVTTDSLGYYVTNDVLGSGEYEFTFSVNGYAVLRASTMIPDIDSLRGEPGTPVSGDIPFSREMNAPLFPLNANVTGKVYTALPAPAPEKDGDEPMAAGDSLVSPVANVEVILAYGWDLDPNTYQEFTNQDGEFTFTNVPWAPSGVTLTTMPFTAGTPESSFVSVTVNVNMVHNGTVTLPNIYAPLDCTDLPEVLRKNFNDVERFHFDSNLVLTFSEPMDTTTAFTVTLNPPGGDPWSTSFTWTLDDHILTIDPFLTLMTDCQYQLQLFGKSRDGCPTSGKTWNFNFRTLDGIKLLTTNLERAPGDFTQFPITSPIYLVFDTTPVIDPLYGWITLEDTTAYPTTFPVAFDASVAGDTVVITPSDSLERSHAYMLCYKIFSPIQGDFADSCQGFETEVFNVPPPQVTGFVVDLGLTPVWPIDWNTTQVAFRWNTLQPADSFRIYAKDNKANSDFIQIAIEPSLDHLQYQFTTVTLPPQFDLYRNDTLPGGFPLQTPFSDSTQITFAIRASNNAGLGPFSDSITLADVVAPAFLIQQVSGSADNTTGASSATVTLTLDRTLEYVQTTDNPVFAFVEDGGDEAYKLDSATDVTWQWNNSYRKDTTAYITVPASKCGAGDSLVVTIYDNSGNGYTHAIKLRPYITITNPVDTTSDFEAPNHLVAWTITQPPGAITWVDYFLTLDGGTTLIDSVVHWTSATSAIKTLDDTLFSTNARVGIRDYNGGVIWWSDVFTYNGLILTGPDSATYDTMLIYDQLGTDSTMIPIAWNSAGIDTVDIYYWDDISSMWNLDTTIANTGSLDWYPPDLGNDYSCALSVRDTDDGEPLHSMTWQFDVTHDFITFTFPAAGDELEGGADTTVGWTYVGDSTQDIILEYSTNLGTTWTVLDTTKNDGSYLWSVPSNAPAHADSGMLRFRDIAGLNTLDSVGPFSVSGVTITVPNGGEIWLVGSAQTITWDTFNAAGVGNVNIYYSINNWTDSTLIIANTANDGSHNWSVASTPSATASIRIYGTLHNVMDQSDAVFTIAGVTITSPNGGENLAVGGSHLITWNTTGTIDSVDIQYAVGSAGAWTDIKTDWPNTGSYTWDPIPNDPSDSVKVRVKKNGVSTGADVSDNYFTISGIIITAPNGGETWNIGIAYNINWSKIGIVDTVIIEYSTNGSGGPWTQVPGAGSVDPAVGLFNWLINAADFPLPPYNNCFIQIREKAAGKTIKDTSNGSFTIQ